MATRMRPSASRVARFSGVMDTVRSVGRQQALIQFNLANYQDRPILDVLSALCDVIFEDTGRAYEDTQDDNISKHAYANTVVRICEIDGIDLDHLTNDQVEVMIAIFIEETIAQRVINDVGNKLTEKNTDIDALVDIENSIYQIVNGLVRNQIMPEIMATDRGDRQNLEARIENIYRIAFDAMSTQN
ncbi:MAG TPA: Qat anti-phage system associated protein QatB [Puia sp.]|nr:Qat anti-phage system associated protein QatB [Puia sp.]